MGVKSKDTNLRGFTKFVYDPTLGDLICLHTSTYLTSVYIGFTSSRILNLFI